ncbi:DUF4357 domain-containing protein [Devosia naphthalenivorans]|uniref:DUF4357 domain-containing protein n=1 Tax=Devosia naphthalenivorans TaxID=2082392 RepID=UPI000D35A766|nr:DUF4357 domain-containing protein [Devosia naphthalenivorans]
MAKAILGEDNLARKTESATINTTSLPEHWQDLPGLVNDPLIDEDAQVKILECVDATGSAPLCELMALLPGHPQPAKAIIRLVQLGILDIEPGLIDAQSLLHRRLDRSRIVDGNGGGDGEAPTPPSDGGTLHRLPVSRSQPEVFFANWTDRGVFRQEPALRQHGIYLALYAHKAYSGWSGCLVDRLVNSNHLLRHGFPDLVIAAVDRNNLLNETQTRVAERQLARAVQKDGVLELANPSLPSGGHVDPAAFVQADRFVREVVGTVRTAGLAFTGPKRVPASKIPEAGPVSTPLEAGTKHFSLHACGVHATAQVQSDKWVVQTGSQVRNELLPSAGSGVAQQRQELLHDGSLMPNGSHLLLTRDVAFGTASSAARFVVGTGYNAKIWRPVPQQPASAGLSY